MNKGLISQLFIGIIVGCLVNLIFNLGAFQSVVIGYLTWIALNTWKD